MIVDEILPYSLEYYLGVTHEGDEDYGDDLDEEEEDNEDDGDEKDKKKPTSPTTTNRSVNTS